MADRIPFPVFFRPTGLAWFTTLRSWLSQWSLEKSNADPEVRT